MYSPIKQFKNQVRPAYRLPLALLMLGWLVLLTHSLALTPSARAATFTVTNTNNSGPGSLRRAINDANNNPEPDTPS